MYPHFLTGWSSLICTSRKNEDSKLQGTTMEPEELTYEFLREITDDFSEERKIGQGGFGTVYKGVTKTGVDVAVKIPRNGNNPDLDFKQFQNEFDNLTKVNHVNIVKFLGYCYEIEPTHIECSGRIVRVEKIHRALCFEYLHNGSLQNHLSDESCGLDWHTCYKIIKGTCEGLRYIHEEESLLHLDLKPDNILLDKDMVPKIADFGLSKIFGDELTRTTKSPLGTLGYQPLEFIEKGEISEKFDIFSLGGIIIRILSGLKGYSKYLDMTSDEFIGHVQRNWKKRCLACCNNFLLEACYYCGQVETCTQIALDCLEKNSKKRPDIVKIIDKLKEVESDNCKILQPPKNSGHNTLCRMTTQNELELTQDHHVITSVGEELIIGRDNEKKNIMACLLEKIKSEKIVILPIYGIGGIGKTTLAKLIYNDTNLKYFSHVWVCVSQRLSPEKIRKSIISKLSGSENQTIEQLTSKEILIVLDDLWEDRPLKIEKLKDILSPRDSTKKVIVLVTTRSEDIAKKICCNIDEPYQIKSLTDQMCWDIIKQKTFFESIPAKEKLEDIGKKIAQKCRGVALAAQTLGSMLHSMEYNQWIKVRDNSIWNGNVSKDASLPQHVLASLKLSYDLSLDDSLKKCFTYCAIFPKGYSIVKSDLIYQWISLDFIKPSKMLSTLQLCEKYIVRLLGLSFLEHYSVSQTTHGVYGEHDTVFTMHDLVHDLAVSLLGDKILDQSNQDNTGGSSCCYALLAGCRKPLESCMTSPARLSALRFLRCLMTELHGAAFEPAESLRVLDLSECEIQTLPDSIGQLKQLRYLKAPGIKDRMVPECIMKLTKLQYLNLANCKNIGVLPNDFLEWQYLNLPTEIEFSGSLHLTKLKYLNLASRDDIIRLSEALSGLTGLKYLNLSHHFIRGELLASFLGNLCDLVHLDLSYCYSLGDRPAALNGLTKLQYLNLSRSCCFDAIEGLQEVFGDLSELRDLNLGCCIERIPSSHPAKINDLLGRICTLTNLESLSLRENNNIYSIPESLGNLRKLHTLDLSYCRSLQRLPASISKIHSLKCLKTNDCWMLDRSTLPQYKRSSKTSSHIGLPSQSDYEIPDRVKIISSPENVEKTNITGLTLEWTRDEKRFVDDDPEVLRELDKRYSVSEFHLEGYSISFLSWMMHLDAYLPGLTSIHMSNIPNCNILPPLGQLLNLKLLKVTGMDNIKKIDMDLYGGTRAFPRLEEFRIDGMKCLEEWNTAYPSEVFPCLRYVGIRQCPRLRFKPSPPRSKDLRVYSSHEVLLSSCGNSGNVGASATTRLYVECCVVPLHQWTLLLHLPRLEHLWIVNCSDLTCNSPNFLRDLTSLQTLTVRGCESIGSLPERLGDLTSLLELEIRDCKSIKTLPDSIQQLTRLQILTVQDCESIASLPEMLGGLSSLTQLNILDCRSINTFPDTIQKLTRLQRLEIFGCPELVRWCKSEENKMKLAHVRSRHFS